MFKKQLQNNFAPYILLFIHFVIWILIAQLLSVTPDMADHWVWSRSLQLSYYEHPPMVAIVFRLVEVLFGSSPEAIELGSMLANVIILGLAYFVCKKFFDQKTAILYLCILLVTPYFTAGSQFMHIDQPYMIFWLINLFIVHKYIQSDNPNWLLLMGVVAGFGALSKYITLLFYFGLFIWCLLNKKRRGVLLGYHLYLAGLISLLIFSPVLIWNYQHDWISFKFQFGRGLSGESFGQNFLSFTTSHLITFSLFFSIPLWFKLFKSRFKLIPLSEQTLLLLVMGLVPTIFFTLASLKGSISDPHWLNVAYMSLFMIFSKDLLSLIEKGVTNGMRVKKYLAMAFVFNYALIALLVSQGYFNIFNLQPEQDPSVKSLGWDITAKQIDELVVSSGRPKPKYIISREYQLCGVLSLYLKDQPLSFSYEKPQRNQWSPVENVRQGDSLVACPPGECEGLVANLNRDYNFNLKYLGQVITDLNGRRLRTLDIYGLEE